MFKCYQIIISKYSIKKYGLHRRIGRKNPLRKFYPILIIYCFLQSFQHEIYQGQLICQEAIHFLYLLLRKGLFKLSFLIYLILYAFPSTTRTIFPFRLSHLSTKSWINVRKFTALIGIFLQSIANMNSMEKRLKVKRCSPFLCRDSQDETPCIIIHPADSELAAKDMLFDLSDNQDHPAEQKTFKVSQWFNTPDESLEDTPLCSVKVLASQHKSLYFARKTQAKIRTQTSQERHLQYSAIPHLKSHLRKLESPDKRQPAEKRKEAKVQKTTAPDENFETYFLKTGKNTPKSVYRPKNASLYKKTKKSFVMHWLNEDKGRNLLSREKTCCDIRDIGERLEVIKEARRNRTLRKLLL